jgi:hypothetical protein
MRYQDIIASFASQDAASKILSPENRQSIIKSIEEITKRPLIVYAAKLEVALIGSNNIGLGDVVGFTDLIANITDDNIDVFIESPGGSVEATQRIVNILRKNFKHIRYFVAGSAYSAATMLALSGDEILMHDSACLGPIDPQINGIPARSILNGFNGVKEVLNKEGPKSLPAYLPLLNKYDLHILEICKDSEERGRELVRDWLERYMLKNEKNRKNKAKKIAGFFSNYNQHKSHANPIFMHDAKEIGVNVCSLAEKSIDLNCRVWELFLNIKVLFDSTTYVKLYENSRGISWGNHTMNPNLQK